MKAGRRSAVPPFHLRIGSTHTYGAGSGGIIDRITETQQDEATKLIMSFGRGAEIDLL
jgi:hypothetical protein